MTPVVPSRVEDLRGRTFGRLTVVAYEGVRRINNRPYHYWICRCSCSISVDLPVKGESLRGGNTKSCGCLKAEINEAIVDVNFKHGRSDTKEFRTWQSMLARCYRESDPHYPRWGGRGIFVCDRWRESFANFLDDMGEAPSPHYTIDRKDNDGPYCKENCRWATVAEQNRNTRKNRLIAFRGQTMILADWAREIGLNPSVLQTRLRRGWSIEEALTIPDSGFGGSPARGRKSS